MNKQDFLNALQMRIRVISEAEQQDILDEYSQHIDLKISNGLNEEAAIADFGSLDALVMEILKAYHVNPTFSKQTNQETLPTPKKVMKKLIIRDYKPALKQGALVLSEFFRSIGGHIAGFFRNSIRRVSSWVKNILQKLKRHKVKERTKEKVKREHHVMENRQFIRRLNTGIKRINHTLCHFLLTIIRLTWNTALLILALPLVALMAIVVSGTGALMVLLVQGYPMLGAVLLCTGMMLCSMAILVLGSGLRYKWKKTLPANESIDTPSIIAEPLIVSELTILPDSEIIDLEVYHA